MSSDEVKKQIAELEALRTQVQRWRMFTVGGVLLVLTVGVVGIISSAVSLTKEGPEQQQFVDEFTGGLKKEVVPTVERIAKQTMVQMKPRVEAELKKLNARAPELGTAFKKEVDKLAVNLPNRGQKVLDGTFGEMLKKREPYIRKMFPDATEAKVSSLANTLVELGHEHAHAISDRLFASHVKALGSITVHLDDIQRTEKVQTGDDVPTWEMGLLMVDLVRDDLKDLAPPEPDADKAKPAATPKPATDAKAKEAKL